MFELQVEGMSCKHCISKVTSAIRKVDDAAKVDVELSTGKVRVESAAEIEEISDAISEAGYPAKPAA
ncbi:hypothetical protein BH11PSE11_BH11PSE11_16030 [soil metagenome]